MFSKRTRIIRYFVTNRAEDVERGAEKPATSEQLKNVYDEAANRVGDYLKSRSGKG